MHPCRVLFICTGNSARSILSEAILNHLGAGRFAAFSAGSQPTGHVNPHAIDELKSLGIPTEGLSSKSWDRFTEAGAPPLDIVITVCDNAASETCPVLFGDFVRSHWGLADPAAAQGADAAAAFRRAHALITRRITALQQLPVETMGRDELKQELDRIGSITGEAAGA
ncbi:arsenate reductase [Rhodanobacter thiooxydans]|uniref:Arsenate reductase n=1 Tax=Rhodanobacter thiooxydans TaxID=416169 RepID=A0A154QG42_9GAMM|nr:arsenate reductase ArsC [Rhodanobacter thiooxydans]EIM02087.1 putative arsenate reductase ArsC [Rhodanobacter thiooxydans LCS2]KZC23146.1 arsenate reductase [Rhodanobacter thiooxydans]MCW0200445.1 arsenate reductase ArsC [Rhodanobacter thiooxydans]